MKFKNIVKNIKEKKWEKIGLLRKSDFSPDIEPEKKENLIQNYEAIQKKVQEYMDMFPDTKFGNLMSLLLGLQRKFPDDRIWIYDRCGWSIMCGPRNVMALGKFCKLMKEKVEESGSYFALGAECDAMKILQNKIECAIHSRKG